jgi:hypothetical protein
MSACGEGQRLGATGMAPVELDGRWLRLRAQLSNGEREEVREKGTSDEEVRKVVCAKTVLVSIFHWVERKLWGPPASQCLSELLLEWCP